MSSIRYPLLAALIVITLGGCRSSAPNLDSRLGYAVNTAKAQQTINPDASRNPDPVAGLDGASAKESIDRYTNTFKEPPPTFTITTPGQ